MSLLEWLSEKPEDLLIPSESVSNDASIGLKQSLDALAKKYTSLGGLHVDGLKAEQVWIQAQMVMEGVADELGTELSELKGDSAQEGDSDLESSELSGSEDESSEPRNSLINQDFSDSDSAVELEDQSDEEQEQDEDQNDEDQEQEQEEVDDAKLLEEQHDSGSDQNKDSGSESSPNETANKQGDDFDLAEFQQHVLQLEQDPEDDSDSIDYGADLQGSSDEDADLHYNDFFAPPAKKSRQQKPHKKVQFANHEDHAAEELPEESEEEAHMENVVANTRKDLFDSDEEQSEGAMDDDMNGSQRLSKFELQQRDLARQIEELENENVGEKQWGMRGEIKASERPQDSLIDADLDFERGSKPAPVNTEESTSTLEEIIKERIRKQAFDDLPRRSELAEERAKRELPELPETKSQKSLAELYEEDHMRNENPEYYSKQDSAALQTAHAEVTDLFTALSRNLDALCSWKYTPKAAAPSLSVVTDQPSISMEDSQPGTLGSHSQLAPQEIYKSQTTPMANSEMSTSLKRHKRREQAKRKMQSTGSKAQGAPRDKDAMFTTLKKGNVTLVDRRGEKRDMRGNAVKEKTVPKAANVKL